jgi:hypothetical protein
VHGDLRRISAKSLVFGERRHPSVLRRWEALYKLIAAGEEGAIIDAGDSITATESR